MGACSRTLLTLHPRAQLPLPAILDVANARLLILHIARQVIAPGAERNDMIDDEAWTATFDFARCRARVRALKESDLMPIAGVAVDDNR